ncbi:MAG TPA: metallophosphoesterase family protein [Sphingomonas sanguinis]|uniref:metallophosphoesterase family protein n=1 Tax=Sphingomonas sanguinis TaxID=33051 RepID=UPI002AC2540D|nr:metallophosphoesterase family protein [Sphingomonas sanguinis]
MANREGFDILSDGAIIPVDSSKGKALKIGVIADAHGNLTALEAVMDAISAAAPDFVVNLGDLVSGPFDPAGSAEVQMRSGYLTIAGNHERQLQDHSEGAFDVLARPLLKPDHWAWITSLPATLTLCDGDVFACHGSPAGGDLDYLLEDVTSGRAALDTDAAIRPRLAGIGSASLVLCGHTHTPRMVAVDGVLIVNPGSVGMPCYRDRGATPHIMEAGSPLARYAIVQRDKAGWSAELHGVPYNYEIAARQAEAFGFPAFAHAARTGRLMPS